MIDSEIWNDGPSQATSMPLLSGFARHVEQTTC